VGEVNLWGIKKFFSGVKFPPGFTGEAHHSSPR